MIQHSDLKHKRIALDSIGYLNRAGMAAGNKGRFKEAEKNLKSALGKIYGIGLKCLEPKILNNLGLIYAMEGRWDKSLFYYNDALEIIEERIGKDNSLYRIIQKNLTALFQQHS
ncbi:MAG: tetratricopeptide repeat protein [Thermodesulfobacteriota bacterium]|nr:tetratricopeptide repeat protein [Thermodesulfobacteriota bacterium]